MKKTTLLLAICFAFQFNVTSQVLIPDTNFEQALLDFNIDTDLTLNGQISTLDAEAVNGTMSIGNRGITDFTGIEGFINIDGLNVSYNAGAPSLDVTAITGLTFINIEGCSALTSLTTTGLASLGEIQAEDAGLTALDLSTNAALHTLNVRNASIADLDLSSNPGLLVLEARNNGLTDLDMRNGFNASITTFNSDFNGGLECIFVDDESAGYLATWSIDALSTFVNDVAGCNTLGIEDESQNVFSMFPNPAKNTVFANVNTQNTQLSIYDITGKSVLNKSLNLGENSIDISHMPSGVYLVRFTADGFNQTKKLIIQ